MGQSTTSARDARNEPVMVHASIDFNEIALIKSMLISADIEFFVEGDSQTDWGPVFAQCPMAGGMKVFVRSEDAVEAAEIIDSLNDK